MAFSSWVSYVFLLGCTWTRHATPLRPTESHSGRSLPISALTSRLMMLSEMPSRPRCTLQLPWQALSPRLGGHQPPGCDHTCRRSIRRPSAGIWDCSSHARVVNAVKQPRDMPGATILPSRCSRQECFERMSALMEVDPSARPWPGQTWPGLVWPGLEWRGVVWPAASPASRRPGQFYPTSSPTNSPLHIGAPLPPASTPPRLHPTPSHPAQTHLRPIPTSVQSPPLLHPSLPLPSDSGPPPTWSVAPSCHARTRAAASCSLPLPIFPK